MSRCRRWGVCRFWERTEREPMGSIGCRRRCRGRGLKCKHRRGRQWCLFGRSRSHSVVCRFWELMELEREPKGNIGYQQPFQGRGRKYKRRQGTRYCLFGRYHFRSGVCRSQSQCLGEGWLNRLDRGLCRSGSKRRRGVGRTRGASWTMWVCCRSRRGRGRSGATGTRLLCSPVLHP